MKFICAKSPAAPALFLESGGQISYAELESEVHRFRGLFGTFGVVFCLSKNDFPSLLCYLASLDGAAVPLLLPDTIHEQQLQPLIDLYKPTYLFHSRSDLLGRGESIAKLENYHLIRLSHADSYPIHPDLALLLATSGSTGSPKLVRLSRRNLYENAKSIVGYLGITSDEKAITSLPIHYSYGLSIINSHLYAGASVVLSDRSLMDPKFWETLRYNQATSLAGVPYSYEILLKLGINKLNMPSIKTLTLAGGKLSADKIRLVSEASAARGIRFFSMYGQTEATARMSYVPSELATEWAGRIGVPIPNGKFWLEDESGIKVDRPNQPGQLIYQGPNVSLGYAASYIDLAESDVNKGILRTGDLAMFDEYGSYTIVGRLARFVKPYGIRISLDGIEKILLDAGYEGAVVGSDDLIQILISGNRVVDLDEIREFIARTTNINKRVFQVSRLEVLPRLSNGKIDYQGLSEIA